MLLLFPNIELRLDVAAKMGFVNVHLLVSPEEPEHLSEVKRILKRLQFRAFNVSVRRTTFLTASSDLDRGLG